MQFWFTPSPIGSNRQGKSELCTLGYKKVKQEMHVLLCIFVCYLKCALKCLLEGEQQKCTNGGKTTYCILLPLQMLSNFIQMNVLRSPPDKFPRNFPPLLDNMKCLTKLMHFVRQDNQSYSNFVHFSSRYHSIQTLNLSVIPFDK